MDLRSRAATIIAGGGLTGISAALHLKGPYQLFEQQSALGGLARTEERDGYFFDKTGHWLHLRDPGITELVTGRLGRELTQVRRRARVFSNRTLIRYPFQANIHGLPSAVTYECLLGYVQSLCAREEAAPRNFEQFILHHFGAGIARHFMVPYNSKLWGVHPREITSAWTSRFVPIPSMEQMLAGAVGHSSDELGYNVGFLYPRQGGIETLVRGLQQGLDSQRIHLGSAIESVDPWRRQLRVGGELLSYHALVSTMPLPELLTRLVDPPPEVLEAAQWLRCTAVRYLNVASRSCPAEGYHWVYVPEERLPFYRVGFYSNAMPSMAPPGCSSIYVELADRAPLADREAAIAEALRALVEIKALESVEDVVFAELREIPYAYVVYDERYEAALAQIQPFLQERRIFSCGRYGSWIYNSMEDSLMAGREIAARVDDLPLEASS